MRMQELVDEAKALIAEKKQIEVDLTIKLTLLVAEETRGLDFVYHTEDGVIASHSNTCVCKNVHVDLTPEGEEVLTAGCLIGQIFCQLYPIGDVPLSGHAGVVNRALGVPFSHRSVQFLQEVQSHQDHGATWGLAIAEGILVSLSWTE